MTFSQRQLSFLDGRGACFPVANQALQDEDTPFSVLYGVHGDFGDNSLDKSVLMR